MLHNFCGDTFKFEDLLKDERLIHLKITPRIQTRKVESSSSPAFSGT